MTLRNVFVTVCWVATHHLNNIDFCSELGKGATSVVEVCAVFCYCLLWLCAYKHLMCVYGACLFYVCCIDGVEFCGNVCCVAVIVEESGFLILGVLRYAVCFCRGCDGCCVFCL